MKSNPARLFLPLFLFLGLISPGRAITPHHSDDTPPPVAPGILYILSMPEPQTHYFEVEMRLTDFSAATNAKKNGYVDLKMPVWTPGSYLIREYAKQVEGFTASINGQSVTATKIRKNTWRIPVPAAVANPTALTVRYRVYANELTVRTSFIDDTHGYVNGASMFLFHDDLRNQPLRVQVQPYPTWRTVSTSMPPVPSAEFLYEVPNFDILVDSPMEIGNHRTFTFTASGVPHTVAQYGDVDYNEQRLAADYKRVCETAASVVGEHPGPNYTFLVHHLPVGGGGLEHLNSTSLQTSRNAYATETSYKGFLTLVAHEYFHLWNVKRIRPIALGPFDYENENYTRSLWEAEGFTSFYEDYILRRAGFHTPEQYLNVITGDINGVENQPGNRVQSVAESSFDAWIKYYRPNENSQNTTISYYNKGSLLASLLNLAILDGSNGERNLDNVMQFLYREYYQNQKRGFTDEELQRALETAAGRSLADFFQKYVYGTDTIDYNVFFAPVGLRLVNNAVGGPAAKTGDGFFGAATTTANGRVTIAGVRRGSAAYTNGLNVGDEILSVDSVRASNEGPSTDGGRATDNVLRLLAGRRVGETVRVLVNRGGLVREIPVKLTENPLVAYRLEPLPNQTERQRTLYARWLFIK